MNTLINSKTSIFEVIDQHIVLFDYFDNVYLFGSILDVKSNPNDIDMLLIYSEYSDKIINDLNFIRSFFKKIIELPIDLVVLSSVEEKDTEFLKKINSLYLKIK
ncbi:MAG: hypothetical protein ACLRVU_05125 [Beduini sp.]|uniref:hypothetical protein n=1 Tax=Beduini sp. TaxID=1922300 RepID=UPI0039A1A957